MATFTTVNNAQFDAALSAVSNVVGSITRIGSVPAVVPNTHMSVKCESSLGVTFGISYNELTDPVRAAAIIIQHHSGMNVNADLQELLDSLEVISASVRAMGGPPYTNNERTAIVKALQVYAGELASLPNRLHDEVANNDLLSVTGVTITSPAARTGRVVATITGEVSFAAVRWSSTTPFVAFFPATSGATTVNHTYSGGGNQAVTLVVFGPGGFFKKTTNINVAAT